jgi:hypothetical protein
MQYRLSSRTWAINGIALAFGRIGPCGFVSGYLVPASPTRPTIARMGSTRRHGQTYCRDSEDSYRHHILHFCTGLIGPLG